MKIKKKFFFLFLILSDSIIAQAGSGEMMADTLRSNGKIYVVVTVLCIIFTVIAAFLIKMDRKVSGLEKKMNHKK